MDTSHLIISLSAIVFCFIFQTFILKTRISESLTSVEETLQKNPHQVEMLSAERLEKVSGIIEENVKTLVDAMTDVSSLILHLKQVHSTQKAHEEKILHVLSKLETETDSKEGVYITVSYMQMLWFVFGILFVSAVVCIPWLAKNDQDVAGFAIFIVLAACVFAVALVILSLWLWFRPGFWLVICIGVCFALVQLVKYIYVLTKRK